MGRPKKQVDMQSGNLTKETKEKRRESESKFYGDNSKLKAPSYLSDEAKKEFNRVIKEMREIEALNNMLSNLDLVALAIYADAYSNYIKLTKTIQEQGAVIEYTNKAGHTNTTTSPYVQAQTKYIDVIIKMSTKLGLSLGDRLKLVVPNVDEMKENKFAKYAR